jgi:hypothetical protein
MTSILRKLALVAVAGLLVACITKPVRNVSESPIAKEGLTDEQVAMAIKRAGSGLGWQMSDAGPGKMEGKLYLRSHVAVVDIAYNPKSYSIVFKDSTNLQYDAKGGTIHKNYNGWIQNLDNAIKVQLSF